MNSTNQSKKIAALIFGDLSDRKGYFNAALSRIAHLKEVSSSRIEVFCFSRYDTLFARLLKRSSRKDKISNVTIDGLEINVLWYPFYMTDYLLYDVLKRRPVFREKVLSRYLDLFKNYDLISAQSYLPALMADKIHRRYRIPYCVTWHGSDIHTHPFSNKTCMKDVRAIMGEAGCNFFVSENLREVSDRILRCDNKAVLYNGVDNSVFRQYDPERKACLKNQFGADGKKVVCFAGDVRRIKNAPIFPELFDSIIKKYSGALQFWVIGDGKCRKDIERRILANNALECRFWGNQPPERMPLFFNCVDVLILPSLKEGLGMVAIEAISCGANVVGSRVGGIPEVVGKEYTSELGAGFVEDFARKVALCLSDSPDQRLIHSFDWNDTAVRENEVCERILGTR